MNDTLRQLQRDTFWRVSCFLTGAGVMIWINSQVVPAQTKPVVTVEQDGAGHAGSEHVTHSTRQVSDQQSRDAAPPLAQVEAEKARHLQRVKELRFSLAKEERLQQERFAAAVANRDSIRAMVAKLGEVGK